MKLDLKHSELKDNVVLNDEEQLYLKYVVHKAKMIAKVPKSSMYTWLNFSSPDTLEMLRGPPTIVQFCVVTCILPATWDNYPNSVLYDRAKQF